MLPVVRRERQIDCLGAQHKTGARKSSRVLNNALNIIWTAPDSAPSPAARTHVMSEQTGPNAPRATSPATTNPTSCRDAKSRARSLRQVAENQISQPSVCHRSIPQALSHSPITVPAAVVECWALATPRPQPTPQTAAQTSTLCHRPSHTAPHLGAGKGTRASQLGAMLGSLVRVQRPCR